MNYLMPSTDFFGPEADQYRDFLEEKPVIHLIPQCSFRVVQAIDKLASAIAASSYQPKWQRRDGSIDYDSLPWEIQDLFTKEDFNDKGYINLDRIHIYHNETLYGLSKSQRESHKPNYCSFPGKDCLKAYCHMESVTTCAALAYRLAEGKSFDVKNHTYSKGDILTAKIWKFSNIGDSRAYFEAIFEPVWGQARSLQRSYFSSFCYGVTALFLVIFHGSKYLPL